jgi:prevent-host-death family protein
MCYIILFTLGRVMTKTINLREANQGFARCVREVEAGEEYVITRNGVPVARLVPVIDQTALSPARAAALRRTHARMDRGWPLAAGRLDRDRLHDR